MLTFLRKDMYEVVLGLCVMVAAFSFANSNVLDNM